MSTSFEELTQVVKKLRDPDGGCPWDLKQTHKSLLKYLVEEAYEYIHAVEEEDFENMQEEMGDILLQVLLHCTIAEENGHFSLESVSKVLAEKLIRRHPHVFKNNDEKISSEQVEKNWEQIKSEEKGDKPLVSRDLLTIPPLMSAHKIGKLTEKLKFDWDDHMQVSYKVEEEWQEVKEEIGKPLEANRDKIKEEVGDLLFSVVQLARHMDIDTEEALRASNKKFVTRFQKMEELIINDNKNINDMNQAEMDVYWDQVKAAERQS